MRKLLGILTLAALAPVSSWAQLAPYNKMGVTFAHVHIRAKDRQRETLALMSLGARLGNNLSPNMNVYFPGLLILLIDGDQQPKGGTEGTIVDHIGFQVADLADTLARVKSANWGMHVKDVPGAKPGTAFLLTPSEVKIELIENKKLKQPVVFDHVHYMVSQPSLKEMEDYYRTMFGAVGTGDTLSLPGGKLVFEKSDKPTVSPTGYAIDHIGFDIAGSHAGLKAFSDGLEAKGTKWSVKYRRMEFGNARPLDPSGVVIELTHGQDGYINYKHIEQEMQACEARPIKPNPCW